MKDVEELSHKIELHYLHLILDLLKRQKIDMKIARNSAQLILSYLPFKGFDDIKHKLSNLQSIYPPLTPLHTYALKEIEILDTKDVLEKMRGLMKNQDIDSALELTQHTK